MKSQKKYINLFYFGTTINYLIVGYILMLCTINCRAQTPYVANEIVYGGQFKDLLLPMPIIKKLSAKNIWGAEGVLPRDLENGIEDNEWCYWGGNPMIDEDGNYHIAICRWREETGHWGWPKSEVAHAVSKNVFGPYSVSETILPKAHNPEVVRLNDGSYILHISGGNIYTSKKLTGPWKLLGKIEIDTRGHKGLSNLYTNLTGVERKDGSFLFFTKRGDVMVSNTGLLGPYKMVSAHNYDRYSGYPEDPVIWKSRHQYHVVYNHAVDKKSVYMRSLDGISWKVEAGEPYDKSIFKYTDGTINEWCKFERPKVVQDEYGRATHLSLAVIDVEKKLDLGNDIHSSKNVILPLVTERLIEIINIETIKAELTIRIRDEANSSIDDIEINSLRLGTSQAVNYGAGAQPLRSEKVDGDLKLTFNLNEILWSDKDYDLKLLGKTKQGGIINGYALLPEYFEDPASLVTLPIQIKNNVLLTEVENFGLKKSAPCNLKIFQYANQKRKELKQFSIPELKPYERFEVKLTIENISGAEYEALVVSSDEETRFWNKIDATYNSVVFKGEWKKNEEGQDIYMGSEQVATEEGASATFLFSGTQARCHGHLSKQMGSFNVYIDNNFIEKIDCFYGADLHNAVIYQTELLPAGLHKLELRATGKHYKGNDIGPVSIDAFSYIQ